MEVVDSAKKIFVVLGMSRSGTSAIARALKTLGIDLGNKLLPGDSRNPKGFFEDSEILYNVNRNVSNLLKHPWMTVGVQNEQQMLQDPDLKNYKNYAIKILQERFSTRQNWGFKDPRTVPLLSFWKSVFDSLNLDDRYVIVLRNPLATAYSNLKFAKIDIEIGLMLWLFIFVSAIEGTSGKKRIMVSYELMLKNPIAQLKRMHEALGLSNTLDEHEAELYANEFIDPKLSHHDHSEMQLKSHAALAIAPLCLQTYELLMKLAEDKISFDDDAFRLPWQKIKDEFMRLYPVYDFIRGLHLRNKELERELRSIHKSFLWKLSSPIRSLKRLVHSLKAAKKQEAIGSFK